ncbi:hypothetical protein [Streptomyces sp. NPDC002676]
MPASPGRAHGRSRSWDRELELTTSLPDDARCTSAVGTRLHTAVAEGARLCGWLSFDSGHHAAAQRCFLTVLRAAAAANDHATGWRGRSSARRSRPRRATLTDGDVAGAGECVDKYW